MPDDDLDRGWPARMAGAVYGITREAAAAQELLDGLSRELPRQA